MGRSTAQFFRIAGLAALSAAVLPCQQPPPDKAAAPIQVTVNLVEVDALVTDSKGRHVPGLKPEDFTVLEDGKPQKITRFTWVDPESSGPDGRLEAVTGDASAVPARTPRREDVYRTIVLLVDNLHTHSDDIGALAPVMKNFIRTQVLPGDLVSVMGTKSGMGIYQSFTSDRRQLEAATDKILNITGDNRSQESTGDGGTTEMHSGDEDVNDYFAELYHKMAMNALRRAIESMRDIPGRKAIVFFSDGIMIPEGNTIETSGTGFHMTDEAEEITQLANRYGVVLDSFDPGGLQTPMSLVRPMGGLPSAGQIGVPQGSRMGGLPNRAPMGQRADAVALNETTAFLARETGGIAVKNTNGLEKALGKAMDDMTGYYLLAYRPDRKPAKPGAEEKEHRIQVKVHRPGLTVRSRKGYSGAADEEAGGAPPTREEELARALFSPFAAGGIGVHLTPLYSASAPDENNRRKPLLRVTVAADGGDLQFQDRPDGGKQAALDVVVAVYDAGDRTVASQDKRYSLVATAAQAEGFHKGLVSYQVDIPLPKAGAYQLRAAVRDEGSGKLGSAYTFLAIPDFNKPGLTLSSLVLGGRQGGDAQAAAREFAPGSELDYGCRLFGAATGAGSSIDVEVRLFRAGTQVYASKAMPLRVPAGMTEIPVTGSLHLTDRFAPGDYAMEFIAHDRTAQAERRAWMDFSISGSAR